MSDEKVVIRYFQYDAVRKTIEDYVKTHLYENLVENITDIDGEKDFHAIIKEIAEMAATGRVLNIEMVPEQGEKGIIYRFKYEAL
jgi:hypothetical protein